MKKPDVEVYRMTLTTNRWAVLVEGYSVGIDYRTKRAALAHAVRIRRALREREGE